MLPSANVSPLEMEPETMLVLISWYGKSISAWHEYFNIAGILWCSTNKLSSFVLLNIALQHWGKLCS